MGMHTEKGASSFTDTYPRIFFAHHSQFQVSNRTENSAQVHITGHPIDYDYPDSHTIPYHISLRRVFHFVMSTFLFPVTLSLT